MDVLKLKVGMLLHDLLGGHPFGQQLQHIADSNSHPPDTRTPTALSRVHCNSIKDLSHTSPFFNRYYHTSLA